MKKIVTRFAPSPTGYLHIGGLRTALFSYLWARKNNGTFRLRIEDTDQERLVPGSDRHLIHILKKFGLTHNGEIVYQSERTRRGVYKHVAEQLLHNDNAYYCFCSSERLDTMRKDQAARKQPPGYDGHCRKITPDEGLLRIAKGEKPVIRLKWHREKSTEVFFKDEIHGTISFSSNNLEDTIILKSDGYPTYHLASVVDDNEMGVSHVIRGEEWLPSAPIHGLLYDYLSLDRPLFYHIPLILNPDRTKLSKRQGHVSVEWYLNQGYLKEALINYIAFLGWNPGDKREFFSHDELVKEFDLAKVNKAGAVFDRKKLDWYNSAYIKNILAPLSPKELAPVLQPWLPDETNERRLQIFNLFFERIHKLTDLAPLSEFLRTLPEYEPSLLIFKKSTQEKTQTGLQMAERVFETLTSGWTAINLELSLKQAAEEHSLTFGDVFWPVRVALSGLAASPPPTDLAAFLEKKETMRRLKYAQTKLGSVI